MSKVVDSDAKNEQYLKAASSAPYGLIAQSYQKAPQQSSVVRGNCYKKPWASNRSIEGGLPGIGVSSLLKASNFRWWKIPVKTWRVSWKGESSLCCLELIFIFVIIPLPLFFTFNIPFFLNLIKENMGNPLVLGFFQHFPVHFLAGQYSNIITL